MTGEASPSAEYASAPRFKVGDTVVVLAGERAGRLGTVVHCFCMSKSYEVQCDGDEINRIRSFAEDRLLASPIKRVAEDKPRQCGKCATPEAECPERLNGVQRLRFMAWGDCDKYTEVPF